MKTIVHKTNARFGALIFALTLHYLAGFSQTAHHVAVSDFEFSPSNLEVKAGDTVIWTNTQGNHNVNGTQATFPANPESFGNIVGANWTFKHVFTAPGSYDYQCDPHTSMGMVGKVIVSNKAIITIDFSMMNPHIGEDLWLALIDQESGTILKRIKNTVEESFSVVLPDVEIGRSYHIDFFADHNQSGNYDPPPADHAWRLEIANLEKDTTISFIHNTNFTDIAWEHMLTVNFLAMNPHQGQNLWLNVIDRDTKQEIARLNTVVVPEFSLEIYGILPGSSYRISFFADHNGNGKYDPPPDDHAWKIDLDDVVGDTVLTFTHNTDFENIEWENRLKVRFTGMTPHIGQLFELYVYDITTESYVDTITINPVPGADFDVESHSIMAGNSYNIDFFADHNGNGSYDPPPDDHAWRIQLNDIQGDTTIGFTHNATFTDIFGQPTIVRPVKELQTIELYPNPASSYVILSGKDLPAGELTIRLLNMNGQLIRSVNLYHNTSPVVLDIGDLKNGTYYISIRSDDYQTYSKLVKSE